MQVRITDPELKRSGMQIPTNRSEVNYRQFFWVVKEVLGLILTKRKRRQFYYYCRFFNDRVYL